MNFIIHRLIITLLQTMKTIWAFISQLDKQAFRAIAVLLVMFLMVIILVTIGRDMIDSPESKLQQIFQTVKASGFALPITVLIFCLAAFIGLPQWALIAGVIVTFGPIQGAFTRGWRRCVQPLLISGWGVG